MIINTCYDKLIVVVVVNTCYDMFDLQLLGNDSVATVSSLHPNTVNLNNLPSDSLLKVSGSSVDLVDFPGHTRLTSQLEPLLHRARAIVYVFDSTDKAMIKQGAEYVPIPIIIILVDIILFYFNVLSDSCTICSFIASSVKETSRSYWCAINLTSQLPKHKQELSMISREKCEIYSISDIS